MRGHGVIKHGTALLQQERRAMLYRTAKGLTKKIIRKCIQVTLKMVIFRGVKFITCEEYFDMVMQVILDQEKPANTPQFVRMYKTTVMGALNTKQSTCEQSAQVFAGEEWLECVCGKREWGTRMKYRATISEATSNDTGAFIVTVSDEAFALLLYDAYIDKWIKRYHQDRRGEPRLKRIVGKYTQTDGASNESGGWSEEGFADSINCAR